MKSINTTLFALCAIILSLVAVNDSWGQLPITNFEIYSHLLRVSPTYTPPGGRGEFEGDGNGNLLFPPPYEDIQEWNEEFEEGDRHLDDGVVYTLSLPADRTFTFNGSLTIQETEYVEEETVAIGRIQAVGEVGNMVTLDGPIINLQQQNWGGILIRTDPRVQLQGNWDDIMRSGNRIAYCHLLHMNATPIQIGQDNDVAQAFVESNRLECNGFNGMVAWVGGIYWFQSNRIENPNFGIQCTGAPDEDAAGFLSSVICNNYISGSFEPAIHVLNEWAGTISNNIIVATDNGRAIAGIECTVSPDAVIANNFVTGFTGANGAGITFDGGNQAWWCVTNPFNNIVTNCRAGIRGNGNATGDVDYCLFDEIGQDGEYVGGADEGIDCQEDADPEFVNAGADYQRKLPPGRALPL